MKHIPVYNWQDRMEGLRTRFVQMPVKPGTENEQEALNTLDDLKKLMDYSIDLICTIGITGEFLNMSSACRSILGYEPSEMIGKLSLEFIHPDDIEKTIGSPNHFKNNALRSFESRMMHKNGAVVPISWSSYWLEPENIFFCVGRDITREKVADERYKSLVNSIEGIVWEADVESFEFTFVSDQVEKILGYTPDEWTRTPGFWEDHIYESDREQAVSFCKACVQERKDHRFEYRMVASDGRIVWIRDSVNVVVENDRPVRLNGVMVEITDFKETEKELNASRELFKALALNSHDVLQMFDEKGIISYISPSVKKVLGYDTKEVSGKHITAFIHPDDVNRASYYFFKSVAKGVGQPVIEFRLRHKGGDWVWVEALAQNQLSNPVLTSYVVNYRDVTEKKKVVEQLKQSFIRYKLVSKATNEAIWEWNLSNDQLYWGEGFERLFGHDINTYEPTIQRWEHDVHPDDLYELKDSLDHHIKMKNRNVWDAEYRFRKANGDYVYVMARGFVLYNDDGAAQRIIGSMRDISEQKKIEMERQAQRKILERTVQQRTRELKELNKELEAFNYSVSHDLRTPLRAIDIYAGLLDSELNGTDYHSYILQINKCVNEMRNLIDDLLEFSKMGKTPLTKEWTGIEELATEIFMQQIIAENVPHAKLVLDETPEMYVDTKLIRIVLNNLLSNAVKYSSHKEEPVIRIHGVRETESVLYTIEDNGIGFEQKFAKKLFKPFARLHPGDVYRGTGAGLAIVDKIISRHNGEIWAEAVPDIGATFYIRLPVPPKQDK